MNSPSFARRCARKLGVGKAVLCVNQAFLGEEGLFTPRGRIRNARGVISRYILKHLAPRKRLPPKQPAPFTLVTLCGTRQLNFMVESLYSAYSAWQRIPSLLVVSDNSLSSETILEALSWWPEEVRAVSADEVISAHTAAGRNELAAFARSNILAKKLAAIALTSIERDVLFVDTDVLWYRELTDFGSGSIKTGDLVVKLAQDYQPAYNKKLLADYSEAMLRAPYFNSGVVYVSGNLCENAVFQNLVARANIISYGHISETWFAEQTILACVSAACGTPPWGMNDIFLSPRRDGKILPGTFAGREWAARHYVNLVRWMFWEDALAFRLGRQTTFKQSLNSRPVLPHSRS